MPDAIVLNSSETLSKYLNINRLDEYYALLMDQNRKVNLVSRETDRADFDRMVAESLLPLDFLPATASSYLDIGAGGGLPSIPILLALDTIQQATLVERTGKKARALESIIRNLRLPGRVLSSNFGETRIDHKFDLITLRYVKLDLRLLERVLALLTPDGKFIYYSTPSFEFTSSPTETVRFVSEEDEAVKSFTIFSI